MAQKHLQGTYLYDAGFPGSKSRIDLLSIGNLSGPKKLKWAAISSLKHIEACSEIGHWKSILSLGPFQKDRIVTLIGW